MVSQDETQSSAFSPTQVGGSSAFSELAKLYHDLLVMGFKRKLLAPNVWLFRGKLNGRVAICVHQYWGGGIRLWLRWVPDGPYIGYPDSGVVSVEIDGLEVEGAVSFVRVALDRISKYISPLASR